MRITRNSQKSNTTRLARLALAVACALACLSMLPTLSGGRASAQQAASDKILFERGLDLYAMNADGTGETQLTLYGMDPAWSPDGTKIVYRCGDNDQNNSICVMNADGSNAHSLTENHDDFDPAWSPDGTRIVFIREEGGFRGRIYVMNADGTGQSPLFNDVTNNEDSYRSPAWSPDGTKVAYSVGNDFDLIADYIYVRPADGSSPASRVTDSGSCDNPSWSPDGTHIVYDTGDAIRRVLSNPPVDENGNRVISPQTIYSGGDINSDPMYSPDGAKIAFFNQVSQTNTDEHGNTETIRTSGIYVRDVTSGAMSNRLALRGGDPAWKINGTQPEPTPTPTPEPTPTPTPQPTPTPVPVQADVAVQLSAAPAAPKLGNNLIYTAVVRNNGPDTATGVLLYFVRPQSANFVWATPAQGTCQQSPPLATQCNLGDIAVNSSVSVTFVTKPTQAGEIVAQANTLSNLVDTDQGNNLSVSRVTVDDGCADEVTLQVNTHIERPPANSRGKYPEHTIRVRNDSGRRLNGLVHFVFDGVPASVSVNDGTYTPRTRCVQPIGTIYKSVGVGQNELVWEPGQVITLKIEFFNPDHERLNYRLRTFIGPDWP
jgi:uncharacterized repeat protein (TIGR01451 family)